MKATLKTVKVISVIGAMTSLAACGGGGGGGSTGSSVPAAPAYQVYFNASDSGNSHQIFVSDGTEAGTQKLFTSRVVTLSGLNKPLDANGQVIFDAVEQSQTSNKVVWVGKDSSATKLALSGYPNGIEPLDYKNKLTHKNKQYFLSKNFNLMEVSGTSVKSVAKLSVSNSNTQCLGSTTNGQYKIDLAQSDGIDLFVSISRYFQTLTYNNFNVFVHDPSVSGACKMTKITLKNSNGSSYNGGNHHKRFYKALRANNKTYLLINGDVFSYDSANKIATQLQGSTLGYLQDIVKLSDGTLIAIDKSNNNTIASDERLFKITGNIVSKMTLAPAASSGLTANNVWPIESEFCDNYFTHKDKMYIRYASTYFGGSNNDVDLVEVDKNGTFKKVTYGSNITNISGGAISTPPLKNICGSQMYSIGDYAVVKVLRSTNSAFKELWVLDASDSTNPVFDMPKNIRNNANPDVKFLGLVDGGKKLAFTATSVAQGKELWVTAGTSASTTIVKDIASGQSNGVQ